VVSPLNNKMAQFSALVSFLHDSRYDQVSSKVIFLKNVLGCELMSSIYIQLVCLGLQSSNARINTTGQNTTMWILKAPAVKNGLPSFAVGGVVLRDTHA